MSLPPYSLEGRRVLVTGASSGIGRATAILLSRLGASIVLNGRDADRLETTRAALTSGNHQVMAGDLTSAATPTDIASQIDRVDGLVHSAGVSVLAPVRLATRESYDLVWRTNYLAPLQLTQSLLRASRIADGGSIVFVGSISERVGVAGVAAYAGTKAALSASARCLAMEVAKRSIRVNTVAPGIVETEMSAAGSALLGDVYDRQRAEYPLGFGRSEDVANLIAFLLSDGARWITGSTIVIDGGHSVG